MAASSWCQVHVHYVLTQWSLGNSLQTGVYRLSFPSVAGGACPDFLPLVTSINDSLAVAGAFDGVASVNWSNSENGCVGIWTPRWFMNFTFSVPRSTVKFPIEHMNDYSLYTLHEMLSCLNDNRNAHFFPGIFDGSRPNSSCLQRTEEKEKYSVRPFWREIKWGRILRTNASQ